MTQARRAMEWVVPGYALLLALAVTAPLLAPGYLLLRDAVSTPRSYLSDTALGLGESAPRAVPQDFLIAAVSPVLDGGVLVKMLLIVGLFLAGWGAARLADVLVPDAGLAGQLVATTLAVWNPYVAERLLQGHWSLLVGYGSLPWVAAAVIRLRGEPPAPSWARWAALVFWVALAGLTPTGLLLAAVVALACVAVPGDGVSRVRCASGALIAAVLAASPWLTASALGDALASSPSSGVVAFAARAEPGLGTLGSLAGLGGIWNAEAVPSSRTTSLALLATVVLLTVVAVGLPTVLRRRSAVPLLVLAAVGVLLPAALATGPGLAVLRALVEAAPGVGVLRDGQKWVALAMPGYAVAGAAAVVTLRHRLRPAITALVCVVAVIAVLPDLAFGVWGKASSVRYPPGWSAVAGIVNGAPADVAVLPADSMRQFEWSGPAPVLDPLPRWVRAEVLATGDLTISGQSVPGEGGHARDVQRMLLAGSPPETLTEAGVGWVVVESGSAGTLGDAQRTLQGLPVAYRDADLTLYRVGGSSQAAPQGKRVLAIATHLVWLVLLTGAGITALAGRRRKDVPSGTC
ncbi:putative transmembrane protein [uncultured Mycobacterium sp.]|uniref:Putative transmembrane protein n=1 Tax=uncultured Mycobacterium sp. TaxID=171292 RepID=A0A1Y5PDU7_9MYCO|nr:putative transmembrane protein [uncultured Mycobacterium sp.]